jgi:hypothetical protein
MRHPFWRLALSLVVPLVIAIHPARAEVALSSFEANGIGVMQSSGGNSYSGQVSWNPTMGLGDFSLRGDLGLTLLKSTFDSKFTAIDYQVFLKYNFLGPWAVEGGGGLQTWVGNAGTHPILSGNLVWETKFFSVCDRIFAGYSRYFLSSNGTNEYRLGLGFSI